ncbi:TetR/AcrR family transcriptional regulator [Gordonia sp. zg691]|uniref:TetR/AcrR family transcriptional regulator n=1 Tax=Gordonia jinghuaiqii TaxID=2758710 RepID=A0A7D7LXI3_9ACTN|nr:TetR/AcrR family transcriptional regulator [Gordonia jinghuaiqii]MBD0861608.1 TetR/AcrR family transcriptional regulator [Gordonia jinghuaiqii]MCR5977489.1 TetR family transcriptional regulator [Gordonia jinghuaiqii]QMT02179.1 TetR/AcrR family transcriptional regulator [Gordonia jinghuaiqii]
MATHPAESVTTGSGERGPRERMIVHAADLIGRDGVAATSIGDVITASSAPRGSIYHHFPGGKTELMTEAVRYAGEFIAERIGRRTTMTPAETVREIGGVWRRLLVNTDFQFGCPVLAGGLARRSEPAVADVSAEVLDRWREVVTARLIVDGVESDRADSLANLTIAAVEGAVGLCQTQRSVEPLDRVIAELAALCDAAVDRR